MAKKVEIIKPIVTKKSDGKKYNVCAYARVSTNAEEQKDSFNNQKKYYEDKIKGNPEYNFVGIFADEAISGTTDNRPEFQKMIRFAKQGHIDIIYTKSISRFTRNVSDLLKYCELLRDYNVNLIFEENGIELLNSAGSLLLTILGAIAQMEVENTSEHVNWTLSEKMRKGELVGQANPLGYDVVDGKLIINEDEAETVRYIYRRYLEGVGARTIAKELTKMGARTKKWNNTNWYDSTVMGILKNEKYTGLLIQGKSYTVSPIGHKRKENKGESNFYKVENNHPAIISKEDFDKVQEIMASRCTRTNKDGIKRGTTTNSNQSEFTSKLQCAYCGKSYVRRMTHPGTKYQKIKWSCCTVAKKGKAQCPNSVIIDDEFLKQSFVGLVKSYIDDEDSIFYLSQEKLNDLLKKSDTKKDELQIEIQHYQRNLESKKRKNGKILDKYLDEEITEEEFKVQREKVNKEIKSIEESLNELELECGAIDTKTNTSKQISKLINEGKAEGFSKELFDLLIEKIVIGGKRSDGVDDPKSLHYEMKDYNLCTDILTTVSNGELRYTIDSRLEEKLIENSNKNEVNDLESLYSDNTSFGSIKYH